MRKGWRLEVFGWLLAFSVLAFAPAASIAQEEEEQAKLTLQEVKDRLKENKQHLEAAKNRGKAGDAEGVETAIENYDRGMTGLNRALDAGQFDGSERDLEKAYDQVEKATRKHGEVLSDLLTKVPEQARPGIEKALANSQKGRETALANLERVRAERQERAAARARHETGQPGTLGRPDGVGRPAGVGGGPAGAGVGRPSGVGSGAPAGGGRGRP